MKIKQIDINNDARIYDPAEGNITFRRSGCSPMTEPELLERLAEAIRLHYALETAIPDMRALIAGEYSNEKTTT